jgi:hypothetical protein
MTDVGENRCKQQARVFGTSDALTVKMGHDVEPYLELKRGFTVAAL